MKQKSHNLKNFTTAFAVFSLTLVGFLVSSSYGGSFKNLINNSCTSIKSGVEAVGISSGSFQCKTRLKNASFEIMPSTAGLNNKRFWSNRVENQWLMWGSANEPEPNFTINVAWKTSPDQYTGNLRRPLRKMKQFKRGKVTVSNQYTDLKVHHGIFKVLPFVYRDQSLVKKCLGFTSKKNNKLVLIRGWLCDESSKTPTMEQLECTLSGLKISGIIVPDQTKQWCSKSPKNSITKLS